MQIKANYTEIHKKNSKSNKILFSMVIEYSPFKNVSGCPTCIKYGRYY
jgi:hypothetical protein